MRPALIVWLATALRLYRIDFQSIWWDEGHSIFVANHPLPDIPTLPAMDVEPSQGSHFFHNLSNTGALYFSVRHGQGPGVDWGWLDGLEAEEETDWIRHVRAPALEVRVDGRTGRGVVLAGEA